MKIFKKHILPVLVLVISALLLTACGSEWEVDLSDPSKPVITSRSFFTEEELNTDMGLLQDEGPTGKTLLDSMLEDDPDLELADAVRDGVKYKYSEDYKYIKDTEDASPFSYIDANTNEGIYLSDSRIIFSGSKKAELYNYGSYKTDEGSTELSLDEAVDFYDLTVKLPFKVYYTNGTKTGKKTVVFDMSFVKSGERCVAVASKKIYKVKKITVKGVKNGKTYKTGQKIEISSKNAIKVFTINGENIAANSYTFDEPGEYAIRIVLANDTAKELKIKIK